MVGGLIESTVETEKVEVLCDRDDRVEVRVTNREVQAPTQGRAAQWLEALLIIVGALVALLGFPSLRSPQTGADLPYLLAGAALIAAAAVSFFVRRVRRRSGASQQVAFSLEPGGPRKEPRLSVGDQVVAASEVEAIALLATRLEDETTTRWTVLAIGTNGSIDLITDYHDGIATMKLAKSLSKKLGVELRQSKMAADPKSSLLRNALSGTAAPKGMNKY